MSRVLFAVLLLVLAVFLAASACAQPAAEIKSVGIGNTGQITISSCSDSEILKFNSGTSAWECAADNSSAGSGAVLDLADDDVDESTGVTEIATSGDTNSIFTEPSADKLLVNVGNNWPACDAATALAANGGNCPAGQFAAGVDANGAAEGCVDLLSEVELDTEAELETQLTDVTDVFTNNDGALNDDNLGDNNVTDLSDVNVSTPADAHILIRDQTTDTRFENVAVSGDATISVTGVVTVADDSHNHTASNISDQNAGTDITADLEEEAHAAEHAENAADELLAENLGTACTDGQIVKADATGGLVCAADDAGTGTPIVIDLADDDTDESTDMNEIATTGDTNSIFTEPTADKLLVNVGNNWPTSDAADALSANGSNCSAGQFAAGVDASGAAEGCVDLLSEVELDTEAELEAQLTDVTDVFTNNDGALNDDNLSDDNITALADVNIATPADAHILVRDQTTDTRFENVAMSGDVTISVTGVTTVADNSHNHTASNISDQSVGTDITADLEEETHASEHAENAADELLGEDLGTTCTDGQVLKADATGGIVCGTDATGGGGTPNVLDLGDDDTDESSDLIEIATSGDTNSIFSEPTADKLLVTLSNNWPSADTADALSANGSNCSAGEFAAGVDANGAAEGCVDLLSEVELDTESELESQLTDVSNVITDNDNVWKSIGLGLGLLVEDASQNCSAPTIATINSKRMLGITCADGGTLEFAVQTPSSWNPGAVDFQIDYANGSTGTTFAADVQMQCRGDNDPITNTYTNATTGTLDLTLGTADDVELVEASTLSLDDGAGGTTCAAGDMIMGKITIDDANHDATDTQIIAARIQLQLDAGGEQ